MCSVMSFLLTKVVSYLCNNLLMSDLIFVIKYYVRCCVVYDDDNDGDITIVVITNVMDMNVNLLIAFNKSSIF